MNIPFKPETASLQAEHFDPLFLGLIVVAILIVLLVTGLVAGFATRFREGSKVTRHKVPRLLSREVEVGWTAVTALLALFLFWWAASIAQQDRTPPPEAIEIHVEAKQWMWKTRSAEGVREINTLHVPVNRPIALYMVSQDVIHSFFVPAFRVKQDVVPGRTSVLWFEATRPGTYRLMCAEYCGTDHSRMRGEIVVLDAGAYSRWLDGRLAEAAHAATPPASLAAQGYALYLSAGCSGCHAEGAAVHAPRLEGLYGRDVPLADGRIVTADAAYLRDSILLPSREIAAGYAPIMPSFDGVLGDGEVEALVAWMKENGDGTRTAR
ncbi:MAG: cytochrome c oxidase subunit II [Lautropia sp.]